MIKYLGSKRTLVPVLGRIAAATQARSAVDLFTGTTRVAQEFKSQGIATTATDIATYSHTLAQCYIATDANAVDYPQLHQIIADLNETPGEAGYFTETFCEASRFFQPKNGARVDAIRNRIAREYAGDPLEPILLTALMEAADRVDSTTGVQMAYLKEWAKRSYNDLELRCPDLLPGPGIALRADANITIGELPPTELLYLDPPYNQHRYFTNYHIWETLIRWDAPEHYGVACKRADARDDSTKSVFNQKREMPTAFFSLLHRARAQTLVVSFNDEAWVEADELLTVLKDCGYEDVRMLAFDYRRYVGAQIGIFNPEGHRVGKVSRLRNTEFLFLAGPTDVVAAATAAATAEEGAPTESEAEVSLTSKDPATDSSPVNEC